MTNSYREHLKRKLADATYKRLYGAALAQNEIALTIQNARLAANMTQADLANKMGVSQAYIAKLESGNANPSISKIGEILSLVDKQLKTHYEAILPLSPIQCDRLPETAEWVAIIDDDINSLFQAPTTTGYEERVLV